MRIPLILNSRQLDENTNKMLVELNSAIDFYNKIEATALPLERLFLLDRLKNYIDFFVPGNNKSLDKSRNAIYRELTTAESFASLQTGNLNLHSISAIKRSTFNFGKSAQEQEIESLLTKLSKLPPDEEKIDSLKLLQNKTLSFIRGQTLKYGPPPTYREKRSNPSLKKLNRLVSILETSTHELIQLQPEKQLILSQINENEKESLRDFAYKLNIYPEEKGEKIPEDLDDQLSEAPEKTSFDSNGFQYTYLGGRNNINWIAEEDGDPNSSFQCVLRIEKADDTNYQLRHRIINTPDLKQHLAHDSFFCTLQVRDNPNKSPDESIVMLINLVVSEFCPRQNIGYAIQNENEYEESKFLAASNVTQQVAEMANDFLKNDIAHPDIKAENFLLRADGKVIIADIKSLKQTDQKGQMKLEGLALTAPYQPSELKKRGVVGLKEINAEAYMSYQTGLMYYMLIFTNRSDIPKEEIEMQKLEQLGRLSEQGLDGLDFNISVFQSPQGQLAKALICDCMNPEPSKRPRLEDIAKQCKVIGDYLPEQKQLQEWEKRLFIPKDSNAKMPSLSKAEGKEEAKILSNPSSSSSSRETQARMKKEIQDSRKTEDKDVEKIFESGPSCGPGRK